MKLWKFPWFSPTIRVRRSGSPTRTPTRRSPSRTVVCSSSVRWPPTPVSGPGRRAPGHGTSLRDVRAVARKVPVSVADVALVVAGGAWWEMFTRSTSPLNSHSLSCEEVFLFLADSIVYVTGAPVTLLVTLIYCTLYYYTDTSQTSSNTVCTSQIYKLFAESDYQVIMREKSKGNKPLYPETESKGLHLTLKRWISPHLPKLFPSKIISTKINWPSTVFEPWSFFMASSASRWLSNSKKQYPKVGQCHASLICRQTSVSSDQLHIYSSVNHLTAYAKLIILSTSSCIFFCVYLLFR